MQTEPDPEVYGRWLGTVWHEALDGSQQSLGNVLATANPAPPWPTKWREVFDAAA